jgi:hypothetical protein
MKEKTNIRFLFMDIGDVLLTDVWVHEYRKPVSFGLEVTE